MYFIIESPFNFCLCISIMSADFFIRSSLRFFFLQWHSNLKLLHSINFIRWFGDIWEKTDQLRFSESQKKRNHIYTWKILKRNCLNMLLTSMIIFLLYLFTHNWIAMIDRCIPFICAKKNTVNISLKIFSHVFFW